MIPTWVCGDFETDSACDLRKSGAWRYAEDLTTSVICFGYQIEGQQPRVWSPRIGISMPPDLHEALFIHKARFIAHNAMFEYAVLLHIMVPLYGWPMIPEGQWFDSMAVCAMKALPQKLEKAAMALRLSVQKDMEGSRITLAQSRNVKKGYYGRTPEIQARIEAYCIEDVKAEVELAGHLGAMPEREYRVWQLDQRINRRGVALDLEYIDKAEKIVREASGPKIAEFEKITGFKPTQRDKVMGWLKAEGVELPDLRKATLVALLGADEGEDAEVDEDLAREVAQIRLPGHVRQALDIRRLVGSASIKKLPAMRACLASDGRAHGILQYHAAGTGRWAGRLLQPQNFPRPDKQFKNVDENQIVDAILTGDYQWVETLYGCAITTVISALRHAIIAAPGKTLMMGDYSTIEARIVLALAGQRDKIALLESGADIYNAMGAQIYKRPINRKVDIVEGHVAKGAVLGLGFQMGADKFQASSAPDQPIEFCKEVVDTYRNEFAPEVPKLWRGLEQAALKTVIDRRAHESHGVTYALEDGWLTARLPSGRKLWYRDPEVCRKAMPWDADDIRMAWRYRAWKYGQWRHVDAYGGLLTENVVQALARDLLVSAIAKCEKNGLPVVMTVHDEIVSEATVDKSDYKVLDAIMCDRPEWARVLGIPVKTEGGCSLRYKK